MKKLTYFSIVIAFLMGVAVTFDACKKEEEKTNQTPTCNITSPANGQEITQGETVTISVEANDSDGSIAEVRFFIDGIGMSSATSFPFNYNWNTAGEDTGSHTIKATSIDNNGDRQSDEITVEIMEATIFTDPRDGQIYNLVTIGTQRWFAENLNYETADSWWFDNSSVNGAIYGRLYTWDAALTACPAGWHLPSDAEWNILTDYLGGNDVAGGKMKEAGTTHWESPNTGASNESGFTALPGGLSDGSGGGFVNLRSSGSLWSATEYSSTTTTAWHRLLYYNLDDVGRYYYHKGTGFSVRCLKDN